MALPTDLKTLSPLPKKYKTNISSAEAPGFPKVHGETVPRRNAKVKDALVTTPNEQIHTVHDVILYASKKYGNAKAAGSRKLVKMHQETKKVKKMVDGEEKMVDKKWEYQELSPYTFMSFIEFEKLALQIGAGLRKLGLEPGDKLHLFASTHPNWQASAHGAMSQSIPIVTAYDTLGEDAVMHSMQQTRAKAVYIDPSLIKTLIKPLSNVKDIKHVIYNDAFDMKDGDLQAFKNALPEVSVQSIGELRKLGEDNPIPTTPPKSDDLCCIMYTSGSTGTPKGVVLKHSNVVAAIAGLDVVVGDYLGPGDGLLTYLPLAHILEFVFENAVLYWGGTMGYGNFRTLSDANVRNCNGDIKEFKPTILVGVPAVWETVKKGIINKVNAGSVVAKNLFWGAMAAKQFLLANGLPGVGLLDAVVFSKVREATGGKLRICFNGGGPISKDTLRFISMAIGPLISGYGLTETAAMGAVQDPLAWYPDALGDLPGCIEMKLVDFPDAGYHAASDPPQGEIWIRGGSVTSGYLDLPKENEEAFSSDGWFKTGDIGEWDPNGQIKIIDRKKNLVKTSNGEYIALEKLESVYRSDNLVQNICVYADGSKTKPIAVIVPLEPALKKLADENGIKSESMEDMCKDDKLNTAVLKQLQQTGSAGRLKGIEIIEGVVMGPEEWTPQNEFVTSAQKLNRKKILTTFQSEIDQAYKKAGS